jgi:hypothetical protein
MPMSRKQQQRQGYRQNGRYAKVCPCYSCNRSAGENFASHPLTDCNGADGVHFGDIALCLCGKCYDLLAPLTTVTEVSDKMREIAARRK